MNLKAGSRITFVSCENGKSLNLIKGRRFLVKEKIEPSGIKANTEKAIPNGQDIATRHKSPRRVGETNAVRTKKD